MDIHNLKRELEYGDDGKFNPVILSIHNVPSDLDSYVYELDEDQQAQLIKHVENGIMYVEFGHPDLSPSWMTDEDKRKRILVIHEDRIAACITSLTFVKREDGALLAVGCVVPCGPFAASLSPDMIKEVGPLRFGLRGYTLDRIVAGVEFRNLQPLITWDIISVSNADNRSTTQGLSVNKDNIVRATFGRKKEPAVGKPLSPAAESTKASKAARVRIAADKATRETTGRVQSIMHTHNKRNIKSIPTPPGVENYHAMQLLSVIFEGFDLDLWSSSTDEETKTVVADYLPPEVLPLIACEQGIQHKLTGSDFVFKFKSVLAYAQSKASFEGYRVVWEQKRTPDSLGRLICCAGAVLMDLRFMFNDYLADPNIDPNLDPFIQQVAAYTDRYASGIVVTDEERQAIENEGKET